MISFQNYNTVSEPVKKQLNQICKLWQRCLYEALVGVYLHGSMALSCFLEGTSDLDLLVVCSRKIPPKERRTIAQELMELDGMPCPIELSVIYTKDLIPWKHPGICQFHYSDYHTEQYRKLLSGELDEYYIADHDFEDPDIACHVKLTRQCGICLYGKPIQEVFPTVPEKDFLSSICNEIEEYDFDAYKPRYFASNVLILGRVLSYLEEDYILSKYEAGIWAQTHVPEKYRYIIEDALNVWYEQKEPCQKCQEDLDGLKNYLIGRIRQEYRSDNM